MSPSPRARLDIRLCLVTDPSARLGVVETALAALRGGATMIQLRDKTASDADLLAQARALVAALAPFGTPLLINDRPDIAREAGAQGAHVGQGDMEIARARALLGPEAILGLSVETEAHLSRDDWAEIDYVGAGPVFATASKLDHAAPLGWDGLARLCAAAPVPAMAIGGLSAPHAAAARAAGAKGLAVVSAICAAPDPEAASRDIRQAWDRAGERR